MSPTASEPLGLVCGLRAEAALLARRPRLLVAVGLGPERAAAEAHDLLRRGARALVSFGTAGGLDPALRAGSLVLPERVVAPGGAILPVDPALALRLGRRPVQGTLASVGAAVVTAAAKAALRAATGAVAVDLESAAVAAVAHDAGVPFAALRVVLDKADRALPPAALAGLAPDGGTRPLSVLAALLRRPQDLPGLVALARAQGRALGALRRVAATWA